MKGGIKYLNNMNLFRTRKMLQRKPLDAPRTISPQGRREKPKSCERKVKRDGQGRIIQEKFVGCSREEIKAMREIESEEDPK